MSRLRGPQLQRIRRDWFSRYPLCVRCQAAGRVRLAEQLDHIVALANGGKDFDEDDEQNRQGLCTPCHHIKTCEDFGFTPRPRLVLDDDGWPQPVGP